MSNQKAGVQSRLTRQERPISQAHSLPRALQRLSTTVPGTERRAKLCATPHIRRGADPGPDRADPHCRGGWDRAGLAAEAPRRVCCGGAAVPPSLRPVSVRAPGKTQRGRADRDRRGAPLTATQAQAGFSSRRGTTARGPAPSPRRPTNGRNGRGRRAPNPQRARAATRAARNRPTPPSRGGLQFPPMGARRQPPRDALPPP